MIKTVKFLRPDFTLPQTPKFVIPAISFLALFVIAIAITPGTSGLSKYRVDSSEISVFATSKNVLADRYISTPNARRLGLRKFEDSERPHKFHFEFDEAVFEGHRAALYIPSTADNAFLTISGIPAARSETANFFAQGLGPAALYYQIPRYELNPGANRAHIHYESDPHHSGLRSVYIGPAKILARAHAKDMWWRTIIPPAGIAICGLLVVLTVAGLIYGRDKRVYIWIGCLLAITAFQFMMSYLMAQPPFSALTPAFRLILPAMLLIILAIIAWTIWHSNNEFGELELGFWAFALLGPVFGVIFGLNPLNPPWPLLTTTLVLLSIIPFAALWLTRNTFSDLVTHRSNLARLRDQVSEQAVELDEKSQIIAQQMQDRAILEERQRFTRDIHDGIGGQLVSLLLRARRGKVGMEDIVAEIQTGINDLRLIVDSMDHVGDDFASALISLRARISRQLEAAQIEYDWSQSPNLTYQFNSSRDVLNLYRFVQEVVTNIVRHADAKQARISIHQTDSNAPLRLAIEDDGKGIADLKNDKAGKGLQSLKQRAQLIGAELNFNSGIDGKGLGVELLLQR